MRSSLLFVFYIQIKKKIFNWNIGGFFAFIQSFYFNSKHFIFKKILGVKK